MADGEETPTTGVPEEEMDLDFSSWGAVPSFDFAFNSENFSDRVLRLEVVAGESLPDSARRPKEKADKRQRIDSSLMAGTTVLTVKTLHINSAIVAARSTFFLKLFSNGMKESNQMHLIIRISDSEENAFMELLSFMYTGKLTSVEPALLLDILMAADRFEVLSCMRHCSKLLTSLPMTTESALLYLDHPCTVIMAAEIQRVVGAAKEFLTDKYKDLDKFEHEAMNISLAGIEAIFSSSDMQVKSEDHVYRFLLKWARSRYLDSEERRKMLSCRLLPLVRFSHMTCTTLQEILACTDDDIDHEKVSKRITEALLHKACPTDIEAVLAEDLSEERGYRVKPVKVVVLGTDSPHAVVYLGLTREECSRLFSFGKMSGEIFSETFILAGCDFYLVATWQMNKSSNSCKFGFYISLSRLPGCSVTLAVEVAARRKPSGKFVRLFNNEYNYSHTKVSHGYPYIFKMPLSTFNADDNNIFIDGVLHLRADLTVVEQKLMNSSKYASES